MKRSRCWCRLARLLFLAKNIDSEKMEVTLPQEKISSTVQECKVLHNKSVSKIRDVARVIGLMISSFSALEYGPLFYRLLEREKIQALKNSKGDYEAVMHITHDMKIELLWWVNNLSTQKRLIDHGSANHIILTDASSAGWGSRYNGNKIGGRWNEEESGNHINFLELLAVSHAIKAFCKSVRDIHVLIKSDNSCAVAYINNMGGIKSEECNSLAKSIWLWCMDRNIWLSATHIPGSSNDADFESRHFSENVEWKLKESIFSQITDIWGLPCIDMFASRLNKQIDSFVSWRPDPDAVAVNGFSLNWSALITLSKLRQDGGEMILLAPVWVTQSWFPMLMEMLVDNPRIFLVRNDTLFIPGTQKVHPLSNTLHMMACRISGNRFKAETFRQRLQISSWHRGDILHKNSIPCRSTNNGFCSAIKGRLIVFTPL